MKIYSWNMLYRNEELDRAFEFISHADFDVFCLQEVPQELLVQLKTLPYAVAYRSDAEKIFSTGNVSLFNVILSRHPITNQGEIHFPDYWQHMPLRARLFTCFMRPFYFTEVRNRGSLYVDLSVGGAPFRVFNLHLILAYPKLRMEEFDAAVAKLDPSRPTIICGDFNIIETARMSLLNWLLGGKISDTLFHKRERANIERRFSELGLTNVLRNTVTHPLSKSQLDHLLISHTLSAKNVEVLQDRIGSDHCPIRAEIS